MKIKSCLPIALASAALAGLTSCGKTSPYILPPKPAEVTTVEVEIGSFGGRPDVFAVVEGNLSNPNAQLVDSKQWREGYRLYIEMREQTPRGSLSAQVMTPFRQKVPVETTGLNPGVYILNVNGIEKRLELPSQAELNSPRGQFL